ncbi:MAG: photosystem II protein Psb27 [Alkalinema sp. CACIAM 70d]|uniref:photosystem II protein Psb27 n=1 Tax=Alkalinema sp. FACHB-956 TaxID=2692768 RepID=UPI000B74A04B|nr:photosystem II protein Psb27 [Alkalinema sp. FACHB-956]MBD2329592.1 photosystem II protein Psb27 [Alkalinema sp. FACHB-956]OUC13880.1 MAG: photosystem II protein Psb27 [Alkalinema sp. CACIAM 70d]
MKRYLSRLLALVLVVVMGLMGLPGMAAADSLTGNYKEDTLGVIEVLVEAIDATPDNPDRKKLVEDAKQKINDFAARYRRNGSVVKLSSFTTMRTAVNSLAGHYSSYPNRPVPEKMKNRLKDEFRQVKIALNRDA